MKVAASYNAAARTYTIKATQHTPATPGQTEKGPVPIPLAVGLLGHDGSELPLTLQARVRPSYVDSTPHGQHELRATACVWLKSE